MATSAPTEQTTLTVHAYDWTVEDRFTDDDNLAIHAWCLDRESKPHLLRINDFPAFCHVELPLFVGNRYMNWNDEKATEYAKWLCRTLGTEAPTRFFFKMASKTYYYRRQQKFPMLVLMFRSLASMKRCEDLLNRPQRVPDMGLVACKVWETSISCVRKLLSLRRIGYSQWFNVEAYKVSVENKIATIENEYNVVWRTMTPVPPGESGSWVTHPGVLGFDIESYSSNHKAMPNQYHAKHVAYMISCIYQRLGRPETRKRYAIIMGDCDPIPGAEVIRVANEVELVGEMTRLVNETDPEILTGYNILGYDYPYLDARLKRRLQDWRPMGRIIGKRTVMTSKAWKSDAYGYNQINNLVMDGRISIDMLPIVRRDHKLDKYDLNTVANHFIGRGKHPVKAEEMFRIYEELLGARHQYVQAVEILGRHADHQDLSQRLVEALKQCRDLEPFNEALDALNSTAINEARTRYIRAKGEMTRVMAYCIEDSELVIDLFTKLNVWIGLIELSNIVGVTITEIFTGGQQRRCLAQLYDLASQLGYVLDKREMPHVPFSGGFVYDPIPGLYENIICLDFASLYPSIMEAFNICFTSLVPPELMDKIPDEQCHVFEWDETVEGNGEGFGDDDEGVSEENDPLGDTPTDDETGSDTKAKKTRVIRYRYKFIKQEYHLGMLPQLVHNLVAQRNAVRAQQKEIVKRSSSLKEGVKYLKAALEQASGAPCRHQDVLDRLQISKEAKEREITGLSGFDKETAEGDLGKILSAIKAVTEGTLPWVDADGIQHPPDADIQATIDRFLPIIADLDLQWVVLEKRQLALKVSANSMFGFLGAQDGGKMPLIEGAMCITAKGRELIGIVNRWLQEKYGARIVYNDTDSSMADLNITDPREVDAMGKRLAEEISGKPAKKDKEGNIIEPAVPGLFPAPLRMEFEKGMRLLCLKKKKYIAALIDKYGRHKLARKDIMRKGVMTARRDNCAWARDTYDDLVDCIIQRRPIEEALNVIIGSVKNLLEGRVSAKKLAVIRGLGANYKSATYFMKVFADEIRKSGKQANPGDRLEYVVVKGDSKLLGYRMRLLESFMEQEDEANQRQTQNPEGGPVPREEIDPAYYIEKALMNPIEQLWQVGYKKELERLEGVGYKPCTRHHFVSIKNPVRMIIRLLHDNVNIDGIRQLVVPAPGVETKTTDNASPTAQPAPAVPVRPRLKIITEHGTIRPPQGSTTIITPTSTTIVVPGPVKLKLIRPTPNQPTPTPSGIPLFIPRLSKDQPLTTSSTVVLC